MNESFEVQVSQDEHNAAFDWLEDHLELGIFRFDLDDIKGMIEQVVEEKL